MSDQNPELKNILEAALLVAGQPLTVDKMMALFPEQAQPTREEIRAMLEALQADYADRGIELKQIDRGYRFQSQEKYAEWVRRLSEEKPPRYSRAAMETLAIIAYRQPVTRGDIEEIRGVSVSTEIIRVLVEREWVRQVGHRDVPGKPALYGTTRDFLEYFNLKSLSELPTLAELRDMEDISKELNLPLDFGAPEGDKPADEQAPPAAAAGENPEAVSGEEESQEEPEATSASHVVPDNGDTDNSHSDSNEPGEHAASAPAIGEQELEPAAGDQPPHEAASEPAAAGEKAEAASEEEETEAAPASNSASHGVEPVEPDTPAEAIMTAAPDHKSS